MEKNKHNDDFFRKILEDHPKFKVPKMDIDDMRQRLDAVDQPQRKGGFLAWLFPLLLLPILLGVGYLFYQNHHLSSEVLSLQNQLLTTKKDSNEQQHITYVYDTIYNTIHKETVVRRTIYPDKETRSNFDFASVLNRLNDSRAFPFSTKSGINSPNNTSNYNNILTNIFSTGDLTTKFNKHFYLDSKKLKNPNSALAEENKMFRYNDIPSISSQFSFLSKEVDWLENINLEESDILFKKKRKSPLHYLSPKGFQLGVSASPLGVASFSSPFNGSLMTYGISSELEYSKNFRLGIGLFLSRYSAEIKDPTTIATLPASMPDDPTDMVRELYITLNQVQIPITFKYLFYKNKRFTPFISGGFAASRSAIQSFKTEFISTTLEEYSRIQNFNNGTFSIKNFKGGLGLEYDFNPKWAASAETYYFHDFELDLGEYFLIRNLGLNLSLKRKW